MSWTAPKKNGKLTILCKKYTLGKLKRLILRPSHI